MDRVTSGWPAPSRHSGWVVTVVSRLPAAKHRPMFAGYLSAMALLPSRVVSPAVRLWCGAMRLCDFSRNPVSLSRWKCGQPYHAFHVTPSGPTHHATFTQVHACSNKKLHVQTKDRPFSDHLDHWCVTVPCGLLVNHRAWPYIQLRSAPVAIANPMAISSLIAMHTARAARALWAFISRQAGRMGSPGVRGPGIQGRRGYRLDSGFWFARGPLSGYGVGCCSPALSRHDMDPDQGGAAGHT